MVCKTCGKSFHVCGGCDTSGREYKWSGYCSDKCFSESPEYKEMREVYLRIRAKLTEDEREALVEIMGDAAWREATWDWNDPS